MPELTPEQQYKKEYDEATAALEAAEKGDKPVSTPAPVKEAEKPVEAAPVVEKPVENAQPVETVEQLRERLAKAEKQAQDNKAWGTKQAQEAAALRREREEQERARSKPAILDDNPELAEAIRYVASDPAPQREAEQKQAQWQATIEAAHPGIFSPDIDPELETALAARLKALGEDVHNPLNVIREIAAEKEAFAVRKATERFAAEYARQTEKSAMSVPTPGGGQARKAPDTEADEAKRMLSMSDADFAKEVRRVKGY